MSKEIKKKKIPQAWKKKIFFLIKEKKKKKSLKEKEKG